MKSQKGISPQTATIAGILIVLLAICFYLYMQYDVRRFEASLPKVPATQPVDASPLPVSVIEEVSFESEEASIAEAISQTVDVKSKAAKQEKVEGTAGTSSESKGCNHAANHSLGPENTEDAEDAAGNEPELYAGMTLEQLNALTRELTQTNVPNLDEKFDLLEAALIDKFGPNPNIPKLMAKSKILHAVDDMALTLDYSDAAAVDKYLSYEPIAVAEEIVELSAAVYGYGEKVIAAFNAAIQEKAEEIENIKLLQETRPMIQAPIDAGELSPEEGEAFIKSVTGLNVTMRRENHTSTVNDRASPAQNAIVPKRPTSPESVDLNIPDFPGD